MGINVLGPLTVDGSGRLGPHDRVVLQALATRPGQPVSADELIDAVWGDHPPASAPKNLQSCIVRLRKVLGTQAIETSPHGYVLAVPPDHLDAHDFEAQVTRARALLTVGESDRVAFLLEQALAQWRGPAFADLPDWAPARREAGRLDELRLEAQEMHVDAMLRSGRPARCWRRRTPWCVPRRCASAGGSSSSSRSTRPAPRARRCAHCVSSAPSWPGSSGSTRRRRCWPWSSRSSSRTPVSSSRSNGQRPHSVPGRDSRRTTSTTPSGSSAATRTSTRASRSSAGVRSSPSWGRPAPASPRSSARACWRPCAAAATGSSW